MVSDVMTVMAPIKPGHEDACRQVLENINTATGIHIDFAKENITHFARFVILADVDNGKRRKRLLFSAIYDGAQDAFLEHMRDDTSDIDAIWGHCEGYTGRGDFARYMKDHDNPTALYLKGFRYETVENIQKYLALRDELAHRFDVPRAQQLDVMKQLPRQFAPIAWIRSLFSGLFTFLKYVWITIALIPQMIALLRFGFTVIEASLFMLSQVRLDREHSDAPLDKSGPSYPFAPGDEVVTCKEVDSLPAFRERRVVQNQVTLMTVNGPATAQRQKVVLNSLGVFIKVPFITRNRVIPTIHFGRWVLIDDNKRMLFISDYDGSVLAYVADFVDRLPSGLNTLWNGTIGWRDSVTLDPEAFNEGILAHNTRASFHYCAYPSTTVTGIEQARKLYHAYHNNINERTAETWLKWL
ncbi:hypothetical protein G4Y79_13055 [Phototrophicus methaneseepsis]|uniref:Uncharacterized protein n=1 Tax=Phototrophicus methaneseepsis TaxID=2710758 RepID=A0A7S8IBN5_9CHLR|nr:hypothetical protein [Phototrophicus methaneseepsis]QPC80640.1 hypothetical protein G4Y79_13055 [Phototrophicus methaneseepsis]